MPKKSLKEMSDNELAEQRIWLDQEMAKLRELKKEIQNEVDRRIVPVQPTPDAHQIGG